MSPLTSTVNSVHYSTAALDSLFPECLDTMEFESWWTERSKVGTLVRRNMLILYFTSEKQFQVVMDDSKVPLTVRVANRYGEPISCYDLHVGAVLDILGRQTTLMAASLRTQQWLDEYTKKMWARKLSVEERVNKFRPVPLHAMEEGVYRKLVKKEPIVGGKINVRKIAEIVLALEAELAEYQ